ncbi:hypothetical protein GTQ99_23070 [Kineococcus sp. T13]|uniref:hypothetical protein n=1 Tax=Kineococcus vitellinus TaxID=2696565 RepID=UPI001412F6E9|nr:hypothetical protein [Kineococcus vitellinus]NAZ78267.1 hypothetical protein [Kineococcus vitellinus]
MSTTAEPAPAGHACDRCTQHFPTARKLRDHVACDHRPAPDGAELVRALLEAPARPAPVRRSTWSPPAAPSRSSLARLLIAAMVLAWVLNGLGIAWSTLLGAAAVLVLSAGTTLLLLWLHVDAAAVPPRRRGPGSPGDGTG